MTTETTDHYSSSMKQQYFELSDDSDGEYEAFRRALHRYRRRLLVGREKKQEYQQDHSLKDDDSTDTKVELRGTIIKSARTDTKVELRGTIIKSARSTTAPSFITNQTFSVIRIFHYRDSISLNYASAIPLPTIPALKEK